MLDSEYSRHLWMQPPRLRSTSSQLSFGGSVVKESCAVNVMKRTLKEGHLEADCIGSVVICHFCLPWLSREPNHIARVRNGSSRARRQASPDSSVPFWPAQIWGQNHGWTHATVCHLRTSFKDIHQSTELTTNSRTLGLDFCSANFRI